MAINLDHQQNRITPSTGRVVINANGSLGIPVGNTAQRTSGGTAVTGLIRFNTQTNSFEGYNGAAWTSLGGVIDVDQDTYITAEQTSDDDTLRFYTAGTERLTINSTGDLAFGTGVAVNTILDEDDMVSDSDTALATQQSIKAYVDSQNVNQDGMSIQLGTPTDTDIADGAYTGWTTTVKVTDAIDDLNEAMNNVRNDTFVRSVTFTGTPLTGGAGTTVTLNLTVDGNPNKYDITWGDGDTTIGTTDTTPSHTYATNTGSPYTVTVRAYNDTGYGTGSEASSTRTDYIIIYTSDPVVAFALYSASTGGSALSGNNLYVIEGNSLYMQNNTTNTTSATVDYTIDWGDGTTVEAIADDNADGGVSGNRLEHTWGAGTTSGTGRDTLTLTLVNHNTADPAVIPATGTLELKVYDPNIAAPDGLSTKTISFSGSTGTSPKLASGATDNTGGTTLSAGDNVSRTTSTSGSIQSSVIGTYAYDADAGTLSAFVNGSADGAVTLDNTDNAGTYTSLVVTDEEDYNLLDANGSSTSFNSSIYHPGLYTGFKARVSASASGVSNGINSFQLQHSATGNTNTVEFVKDDLTATPTVAAGTITQNNAGTFRYVSGIPYYNSGSPTLTLSGVTLDNFIGQTYRNTSTVVEVASGTNYESTSGSAIGSSETYTYAEIDGTSTFLTGGIPNANTGNGTPYAIGDLTVAINTSNVRTVESVRTRAYNVNGTGSYTNQTEKIAVHTAAQSGISEIAIAVADSLGITYDDDGVRIFDFSADTTDTPSYTSSTNFYTNSLYTESADPGVAGTKEATIRLGVLKHDITDYSTGFLPVGPNRSGDTGTQYFTFAFRRQVVANFNINITSSTGVEGVFIAAPGTAIDSASGSNGWLDCSIQYAGSGVPGSNTGSGGNGSDGCASTGSDRIQASTALSGSYTMTLGSENMSNATGNVVLVRIALGAGDSVTALSIS